ncbi:hypothetical protein P879_10310 [Paragonimus westermani]|uniref:Uncharacterized protein n=1 Tax=Paragonimus westermani TaxID=34504 RepID=A0A8T0DEA9_9TREM|nr:hypothetical protein P879_10310 [Paragonimus westermani]
MSSAFRDDNPCIHDGYWLVTNCLNTLNIKFEW